MLEWPRPAIRLPVEPSDLDLWGSSYVIWPFGVRGGGHPEGHPGIDFSWNFSGPIYAVIDSIVISVSDNMGHKGTKTVRTMPVGYPFTIISYDEVTDLPQAIVMGAIVKKGDVIAHPFRNEDFYMFHFDIARMENMFSLIIESPELYFDPEALAIIGRSIWEPGTLMNKSKYTERNEFPFLTNIPKSAEFIAMYDSSYGWPLGVSILGILAAALFITNAVANKKRPMIVK